MVPASQFDALGCSGVGRYLNGPIWRRNLGINDSIRKRAWRKRGREADQGMIATWELRM